MEVQQKHVDAFARGAQGSSSTETGGSRWPFAEASNDEGHGGYEDGEGPGGGRQDEGGHRTVSLPPIQPIPRHTPAAARGMAEPRAEPVCALPVRPQDAENLHAMEAGVGRSRACIRGGRCAKEKKQPLRTPLAAVGSGANSAAFGDACVPCLPCQTAQSRPTRSRKTTRSWWKRTNS